MLTLFWDEWGVILEHYMPRWNVQRATYADLLKNHLRPAIKSKRRGLLSTGVLLQHDNARSHTARSTVATIQDLSFRHLPHPPYSPDLAPSDFHIFGPLRGDGRQVFQVWRRGAAGGARVAALSVKILFFLEVSMHLWSARMLVWNAMETVEKWCHCVPYMFNNLWDKKYLRFLFDSPTYVSMLVNILRRIIAVILVSMF